MTTPNIESPQAALASALFLAATASTEAKCAAALDLARWAIDRFDISDADVASAKAAVESAIDSLIA